MDTPDVEHNERKHSWRTISAGTAVVAAVAVTSSLGWWDASGTRDRELPDVEVVDTAPAGDEAPEPAPGSASSCATTSPDPAATEGDGGTPNAWSAGDEAVRRWLVEHGQDAPGNG